jgi:glycosyltransferase involved in cell wall biosynthesis
MPEHFVDLHGVPLFLLISLITLFLVQAGYYFLLFLRLVLSRKKKPSPGTGGVSVVICAHNEYYNLRASLPLILQQDYPEYEVLVVNHASEDETSFLLSDLQREFPHLKSIEIRKDLNFFTGKKFPLAIGIRSARYEKVLLTDADCRPSSAGWIRQMLSAYRSETKVVLGYSPYARGKGILNRLIRFDAAHIATQYLSYALAGIPYMGVGRNLSYLKSVFFEHQGFISHYRIASGDDDLFINRVADKSNTAVMVHPDSFMLSEPKKSFNHWMIQKRRHLLTPGHYRFRHKFLLGLYSFSLLFFYLTLGLMLSLDYSVIPVLGILILRIILQYTLLAGCFRKLKENDLILFIPLLEIVLLLINTGTGFSNIFRRPDKWK